MYGTITSIDAKQIGVDKVDEGYQIQANWGITQGAGETYKGPFNLEVSANGAVVKTFNVQSGYAGEFLITGVDVNITYNLRIIATFNGFASLQYPLLFHTYENVAGVYDGKVLNLSWKKTADDIAGGDCFAVPINGAPFAFPLEQNLRHKSLPLSVKDLDAKEVIRAYLIPYENNITSGPQSKLMTIYTEPADITYVASAPVDGDNKKEWFQIGFAASSISLVDLTAYIRIFNEGTTIAEYKNINITTVSPGNYSVSIQVERNRFLEADWEKYELELFLQNGAMLCAIHSDQNRVHLSETAIFRPGYYPVMQTDTEPSLALRLLSADESQIVLPLAESLFSKELTQPIVQGGLSVSNQKPYTLVIGTNSNLSRTDYTAFLASLELNGLTTEGVYVIAQKIAQHAMQNTKDMLFFQCGMDETRLMADVRPGYVLRVETENYMPNYYEGSKTSPGYVNTHMREFQVSTRQGTKGTFLEFDSFLDRLADNLFYNQKYAQAAGGIQDLFYTGFRQPFYRISYPAGFNDSVQQESSYTSDQVVILGAESYQSMQVISDQVNKDRGCLNGTSGIPVIFFRGRSSLTLCMSVWVNGQLIKVPVGTTLGKMLEQVAVCPGDAVPIGIKRMTSEGYLDIRLNTIMDAGQKERFMQGLPLTHGDRIEV